LTTLRNSGEGFRGIDFGEVKVAEAGNVDREPLELEVEEVEWNSEKEKERQAKRSLSWRGCGLKAGGEG
jgi:hypothetical protein